jgi:RNA polymerase sigma-70 factor (ECF subfamily)
MDATSMSLLASLQRREDPTSWNLLLEIYRPLLLGCLRGQGTPPQDVEDLIQDVLVILVRELPNFRHSGRPGAFRAWLRSIAANRLRSYWRTRGRAVPTDMLALAEQFDDPQSELSQLWDQKHDHHVLSRLLELSEGKFEPNTAKAFRRVALEGASPTEVAAELDLSVAAVYIAKSRVLRYLREVAEHLID